MKICIPPFKVNKKSRLANIFLYSALFFAFLSIGGVYKYKIYSYPYFALFWIYELLFFMGLKSKMDNIISKKQIAKKTAVFELTKQGIIIIYILNFVSISCFVYFLYLYQKLYGIFSFGAYTADSFASSGRTALEKFTLLLMQIGGDSSFLIVSCAENLKDKKLKKLSSVCLFLPGLRYLLMGARFTIAVEFLLFFSVKSLYWKKVDDKTSVSKNTKIFIIIFGLGLFVIFLYLFSSRSIYYTALERKMYIAGDMVVKPFWRQLYEITAGKISFLFYLSTYLGEAPYVFAYSCANAFPERVLLGQITFRSVLQILGTLFPTGYSYTGVLGTLASGRYSGFGYILVADFGIFLSPVIAYLIGAIFARVEYYNDRNRICNTIYPALRVICFFAPVYYFYVGRIDYTILFAILLTPFCLRMTWCKPNNHIKKYQEGKS